MRLQVFDLLPGEAPSRGQATEGSKSFVVGSYSVGGGLAGLRRNSKQVPLVTRLLCNFGRALAKDFLSSCVGIFRNLRTRPHKDSGNQKGTLNLVAALEHFEEGGIWVQDEQGDQPCPFPEVSEKGVLLSLDTGHVIFDSRRLHCTQEWKGQRTVLVAFTSHLGPALSLEDRKGLTDLGFILGQADGGQELASNGSESRKRSSGHIIEKVEGEDDDNPDAPPGWWQLSSGVNSDG